jgi:hypothetical protein
MGIDLTGLLVCHQCRADPPDPFRPHADLFRLPFRPGGVDVVYSIGVLHHTPDGAKATRKVLRVEQPGFRWWPRGAETSQNFSRTK